MVNMGDWLDRLNVPLLYGLLCMYAAIIASHEVGIWVPVYIVFSVIWGFYCIVTLIEAIFEGRGRQ